MAIMRNIPAGTLAARAQPYTVGPYSVPAGMSSFSLSADVSQAMGAGNSFDVGIERSIANGPWQRFDGFGETGGYASDDPQTCADTFWIAGDGPTRYGFPSMRVRVVITVTGAPFVVTGGTLVVT